MGILEDQQQLLWLFYWFVVGACVGSFLNVVIYRLPKKESLVRPGSHCTACNTPIRWYNNIPLVSYLVLRGRCANCGASYSPRYLLVELITALLFTTCYAKFGLTPVAVIMMLLCASLVAVTFIDLDHMIIPDVITLPGIVIGFLCAWLWLPVSMPHALLGFAVGGGLFWILAVAVPGGMGGGDIKLMAMLGAFLGIKSVLITIFAGSLFGSIVGIAQMIFYGKGRRSKIPFGPYLVLGALLAIFREQEIVTMYLNYAMNR